jgi:hypothetical protein
MVAHTCHPKSVGSINRKIVVQASLGIKQDPISNTTKPKRTRGAQLKWKSALLASSTPHTTKIK